MVVAESGPGRIRGDKLAGISGARGVYDKEATSHHRVRGRISGLVFRKALIFRVCLPCGCGGLWRLVPGAAPGRGRSLGGAIGAKRRDSRGRERGHLPMVEIKRVGERRPQGLLSPSEFAVGNDLTYFPGSLGGQ